MKLRAAYVFPIAALLLSLAAPALAQDDEEGRYSIGVGGGMVQTSGSSDPYLTANFRSRLGGDPGDEKQGSVFGFLEPEVGYWSRDDNGLETTDTLLGVNVGGAVRLRAFGYHLAAGVGYHMIDRDVRSGGQVRTVSDDNLGVNVQVGFDVRVSDAVSIFGVGRTDLLQVDESPSGDSPDDQQSKVYLGLRFHL
jgi:opacity protein-like surface antigen